MMFYFSIVILFLLVLYFGQVFGFIMQSYRIKELRLLRSCAIYIPFIVFRHIFYFMRHAEGNPLFLTLYYIFLFRDKAIVSGIIMNTVLEKYLETHPKVSISLVKKSIPLISTRVLQSVRDMAYA